MSEKAVRRAAVATAKKSLGDNLLQAIGDLGVALANEQKAVEQERAARGEARALVVNARSEGAGLVTEALSRKRDSEQAYTDAWATSTQAGWSPAHLSSMGYHVPKQTRVGRAVINSGEGAGDATS